MHRRVLGVGVLLDGVALVRLDGNLALVLDLGNFTTRFSSAPLPGD
jgi:hypothetical protein